MHDSAWAPTQVLGKNLPKIAIYAPPIVAYSEFYMTDFFCNGTYLMFACMKPW
jgi:hypothetical protein